MRATEFITELFDPKQQTWEWVFRGSEEATADFNVGDVPYRFHAYSNGENDWEVEFKINSNEYDQHGKIKFGTKFGLAGTGNSTEVMATVVGIMREFLQMYHGKIDTIGFTAEEPSRQKLYMRMMKRLLPDWVISTYNTGSGLGFTVVAPDDLDEDFSRRGFLGAMGAGAMAATGVANAKAKPAVAPQPKPVADNPNVELLMKWAKKFITNPAELAAFMAQCAHESDNFKAMEEYGSPERFAKKYDIQYNPTKAKQLGNDKPGDGIKYRGRGYIQLTGKYNYEKAGEWISKFLNHPVDFVKNPDLVATPTAAALSSLWYWMKFVHPKHKNFSNTKQVTKNINPGLKGQQNREQKARDWQAALNVKPIKPGKPIKVAAR